MEAQNILPAEFYYAVVEKKVPDEKGGEKTIYVDEPRIKFRVDNHSTYEREVQDEDKIERPKQWASFAKNEAVEYDGTPLSELPFITPATLKNLHFMGLYTAEQLAEVPEGQIGQLMGGIDFKTKAQGWIAAKAGSIDVVKLSEQQAILAETAQIQNEQIEELKAMLAKSEAERKAAEALAKKAEEVKPKSK
jgi:uncharacterized small protein (DUF1192 family)